MIVVLVRNLTGWSRGIFVAVVLALYFAAFGFALVLVAHTPGAAGNAGNNLTMPFR